MYLASLDDPEANRRFAESLGAAHVVLSDPSGEVARAYGVVDGGSRFARRWTFVIDREGRVLHVDRDVRVATAGRDLAATLERLGIPRRAGSGGSKGR